MVLICPVSWGPSGGIYGGSCSRPCFDLLRACKPNKAYFTMGRPSSPPEFIVFN